MAKSRVKICDDLWSKAVHERAGGKCEFCGSEKRLQSHHVIPRTNYATRYLLENGVRLCYKHHFFWAHKDALDFSNWFKYHRNNDYFKIENVRHSQEKNNYEEIEHKLKEYLK